MKKYMRKLLSDLGKLIDKWIWLKIFLQKTVCCDSKKLDSHRLFINFMNPIFLFVKKKRLRDTRERDQEYRVVFVNNQKPNGYTGPMPLKYSKNRTVTSKVAKKKKLVNPISFCYFY
jgi:hypothetical protein